MLSTLKFFTLLFFLSSSSHLLNSEECQSKSNSKSKSHSYSCNSIFTYYRTGLLNDKEQQSILSLPDSEFIQKAITSPLSCEVTNMSFLYDINNLTNQSLCRSPSTNTFYTIIWKFCTKKGDEIKVKTYNDFSVGGILIGNGAILHRRKEDIYWNNDLSNPSLKGSVKTEFEEFSIVKFELYGGEICCGAGNKVLISRNKGEYKEYHVDEERRICKRMGMTMDNDVKSSVSYIDTDYYRKDRIGYIRKYSPQVFQNKNAFEKVDSIWKDVHSRSIHSFGFFNKTINNEFFNDNTVSFSNTDDILPLNRNKVVHTMGITGKVRFLITNTLNNKYTGILKEGNSAGILRFSVEHEFNTDNKSPSGAKNNFIPSLSFKFLITNQPSANILTLNNRRGAETWNFFKPIQSTSFEIKGNDINIDKSLLERLRSLARTSIWVNSVGLIKLSTLLDLIL